MPAALPAHLATDAVEMARYVRSGDISPVELVADTLHAIESIDPQINAFTVLRPDQALAEARAAERVVARGGEELGPLHGVPVSVKDAIWLRGLPAANGCPVLKDFIPTVDAIAVARLKAAGAIIIGKTNNPEFCAGGYTDNRLYGLTRNPWDLSKTPGGSSGGAAAAVATGLTPLSLGSDGGGSIREPASFCGVVGMLPTFGLIPTGPGFQGWPTLGGKGPLCRSVRDAALALSILAGPDPVDYTSLPTPASGFDVSAESAASDIRIGYSLDLGYATIAPEVEEAFDASLSTMSDAGWNLRRVKPDAGDPSTLLGILSSWEAHAPEGAVIDPIAERLARATGEELPPRGTRTGDYIKATAERRDFARSYLQLFDDIDVLITPSVQVPPFTAGTEGPDNVSGIQVDPALYQWCSLSFPATLAGLPAVSVPAGLDRDGLPVGLQVMGNRHHDLSVLQAAFAWSNLRDERIWPPLVQLSN